jgi:hypothetical protein
MQAQLWTDWEWISNILIRMGIIAFSADTPSANPQVHAFTLVFAAVF